MLPRLSTPPTGPRGSSPSKRGVSRGGIQKRRNGTLKVDKDGDLLMEPVEGSEIEENSRGRAEGGRMRSRTAGHAGHSQGASRGNFATQQVQSAIIRGLESQQATVLKSRIDQNVLPRQGHFGGNSRRRDHNSSDGYLRVRGLMESRVASNPDGGLTDLLGFLERKASGSDFKDRRGVRITKSYVEGDSVIISASTEDLARIGKLDNVKFAGTSLMIEHQRSLPPGLSNKDQDEMSQEAKTTQDQIKSILSARYDVNLKLLNLSQLGRDGGLVQMGMFDAKRRISKLFSVLMVVCDGIFTSAQQKRDAIVSVTLADNDLDNISAVAILAQTFPDLQNLDLSRNKIADLRALEGWRGKFRRLEILRITENPIAALVPGYSQELAKWFPTLQVLNDVQIGSLGETTTISDAVTQAPRLDDISPIPIRGPDFRDVNQVGEGFVRQFFNLYDTDRATLANSFYGAESIHSLSINVSAPRSEHQPSSYPFPNTAFRSSRNLVKLKSLHGQMSRLFRGPDAIKSLWAELPSTKHPNVTRDTNRYLVDCHSVPGLPDLKGGNPRGVDGLLVMVHGEFEEQDGPKPAKVMRSFSRTLVLGPGPPNGPSIYVISDLLVMRAWSSLASPSVSQSEFAASSMEEFKRQEILEKLTIESQMTQEYASLCLTETGWDIEKALVAFHANKSKLPANAFTNPRTTP